jgi:hypothetical protein
MSNNQAIVTCDFCGDEVKRGRKGVHMVEKHPEVSFYYVGNHLHCGKCKKPVKGFKEIALSHLHKKDCLPPTPEETDEMKKKFAKEKAEKDFDGLIKMAETIMPLFGLFFNKPKIDVHSEAYLTGYHAGFKEGVKFGYDLIPDEPPKGMMLVKENSPWPHDNKSGL